MVWGAYPFSLAVLLGYVLLALKIVAGHHQRIHDLFSNVENKTLRWLRAMLLILLLVWLYHAGDFILTMIVDLPEQPEAIENLVATVLLIAFCYFGLRQGAIFELVETAKDQEDKRLPDCEPAQRLGLTRDHADRIAAKLETVMTKGHLYRDSMLTLRQLSDKTRISEHHISEVLNHHLNSNFYDFVNKWRIDEAMQLLASDPQRTALSIAMDVGFNSKSTFYSAFKKLNGQSPIAYRQTELQAA
ncbi:MAG: helix-turn-helix domain-containing protein [Pseudomonadota bacterium]